MATFAEASNVPYPASYDGRDITPLEGRSLLSIFADSEPEKHEAIYWEHEGNRAVRKGEWKLVCKYPGDWELYNMKEDRTETRNLAKEHPDKVHEMSTLYELWAERTGVIPWAEIRQF